MTEKNNPDGWKLVPIEPTKEMWVAVNKLDDEMAAGSYDGKGCSIEQAWNCMIAAAPSASAQQAEPVDGCTEENCRRCRTPEALRTPDMYHAGLSTAAEIADEVCAKSRNHLFRSGAKVVAGAIRSAAPAPGASPEPYNAYQRDWEKVVRWVKFQSETFPELASMSPEGAISWLVVELAARHEKFAEPSVSPAKKTRVEGYHERRGATNPVKQS